MEERTDNANEAPPPHHASSSDVDRPGGPAQTPRHLPTRIRQKDLDWLAVRLSVRDWHIVETINLVRVASGQHLERVCFAALDAGRSRTVVRSRVLARLTAWRVIAPVGRRVGGKARGSTAQVYALDSAGQRLLAERQLGNGERPRVRRPGAPGIYSLRHLLAVTELYAALVEQARATALSLDLFQAEPAAHWPDGRGGVLKPDAYTVLARPGARDHWWIEVDLATESLPTVKAKLQVYVDFRRRGERGPNDLTPWVLLATTTDQRREALTGLVRRLPEADDFVRVVLLPKAAEYMFEVLRE